MPNVRDNNRAMLLVEDHAPVIDTKPRPRTTFQSFNVAMTGACELLKAGVDALAYVRRKLQPLNCRGWREPHRLHAGISHNAIYKSRLTLTVLVGLTLAMSSALAVQPDEILKDPALESRARALSQELRCMVCQNQSIDDSDAPLAKDLRVLVRERLSAGDSDGQVIDFLVARYGEFVLLKPRMSANTLLLWLAPFAALTIGGWGLIVFLRRRGSAPEAVAGEPQLTPAEQSRVTELLKDSGRS
jgi:cytochrome c-type biogenesis protein CcmH